MTNRIALILAPGFADWEYALIAGTGGPFYGLEVDFFASAQGKFRSQGGLVVEVSRSIAELTEWHPDVLAVIGGTIWETENAPDISWLLKEHHDRGATLAGICGGTLALARAGLLNDRAHTSNDLGFLERNVKDYAGGHCFVPSACAISDSRVITAPGTAPVSFAAEVFRAAGMEETTTRQFRTMLAAEHGSYPSVSK
ncbi:DJ-1/PfpI family protein [Achromobacter sp. Marseille-Q0513]|uniref:DJ-1/PfpI family protein n=1 Tax=Achromobacter sp. Marseille-Q0513 TaxID=2829161 RepID=UPI001B913395|nr:DJ-1/PfpI family protein [Achromobacter sp. Marseille-Q0513]MBR8655297.1 DJ-1/PfpI family protein [Achromobacter sp. Marseille-Q0513]